MSALRFPHVVPSLIKAALQAADPRTCVRQAVKWDHAGSLKISAHTLTPSSIVVLGAGKASVAMSAAAIDCLRTSATCPPVSGLIVTKYGHCAGRETLDAAGINIIEAGHPVPDANGMAAAAAMMELVNTAAPGTLILLLLSGGGSALLPLPPAGMSLADLQGMNSALLACGASIDEVNMLRKHTSRIAGGRLAAAAARRPGVDLITLVLSDVVGDRLDVIASGPTVPDAPNSTWAACNALLAKYDLVDARDGLDGAKRAGPRLPVSVLNHFIAGARGEMSDTPKPPDLPGALGNVHLVGSNGLALAAVSSAARSAGYTPVLLTDCLQGEAKEVAKVLVALAQSVAGGSSGLGQPPLALIAGGETTVTLGSATGKGGRCQEMALAAAIALQSSMDRNIAILAFGTDGTDGPTDAAGAIATSSTCAVAHAIGLEPDAFLANHDGYTFFQRLSDGNSTADSASILRPGGLIVTGATGTNVMDVTVALIAV